MNNNSVIVSLKNASITNDFTFEGWGTSLCWWANRIGYSEELTEKSTKLFFGESGLRLNIMRYNIGGGDNPKHKHITRTDSVIPGWLVFDKNKGTFEYDYSADYNQLNVLKHSYKEVGKDAYVEVFSNSPPYFMTKSGCSSGGKNPNNNNLKKEYYTDFAKYLAHVTQYINNDLGITVKSVSPMNEPNTGYWKYFSEKQEGCHFSPGITQNKILLKTANEFKKIDLNNVLIVGSDETSTSKQITSYNSYNKEVKNIIKRINTHSYGTRNIKKLGELMKTERKNIWMSETDWSGFSGKDSGEMGAGLWLAKKIISDFNGLSPSAWIIWLVIDLHISKNGYAGNKDFGMPDITKGFWGVAVADHDKKDIILTQKYYSWGQFTRHIRPGDTILHCNNSSIAAYNRKSKKLVIVAVNDTSRNRNLSFIIDNIPLKTRLAKVIRTSGNSECGEKWEKLCSVSLEGNVLNTKLKPYSITTFIFE